MERFVKDTRGQRDRRSSIGQNNVSENSLECLNEKMDFNEVCVAYHSQRNGYRTIN